jgi:hypothetical protein
MRRQTILLVAKRALLVKAIHRFGHTPRQWTNSRVSQENRFARNRKFVLPQLLVRMQLTYRHHFMISFN